MTNDPGENFLYRGTIRGWPGSESNRRIGTTCTSADPFVAVHFAIECRNKGEAILLEVERGKVRELESNHFALFESAVNLDIAPADFPDVADAVVEIDLAIQYIESLGFTDIPVRIRGNTVLHDLLKDTYAIGLRMTIDQLHRFNVLMFGEHA